MNEILRPPIPYFGAKITIAEQIVALMPQHAHYVEPYAGSLAVLLAKPLSPFETINDLDGNLVTFWRTLRDNPEELARRAYLTPHSRTEYEEAKQKITDGLTGMPDIDIAYTVWVVLTQGRGGGMRHQGWRYYRKPTGSYGMPSYINAYTRRLVPAAQRISCVSLENRDALDVIDAYGQDPDTLLYLDPPYLGETRNATPRYVHEMQEHGPHVDMLEAARRCTAKVMISVYSSTLYSTMLDGWSVREIDTWTGQGSYGQKSHKRTEMVWANFPLIQVHQTMLEISA